MQPILESLAIHLIQTSGHDLGDCRIILPNRRSGLFLQRHLARHSHDVRWSPRIYAINDFISEISLLKTTDPIELLFILYDIYEGCVEHPEPFDEFYFWGEIMLNDFDELDKYLVDANMLFSNIIDLKDIEEPLAGLDEEQIAFIRQFWTGFHEGDRTPEKDKFLDMWKLLPLLYHRLREQLESMGQGYPGMQYREITERIENNGILVPGDNRTVIAGFNALNGCEKRFFSWLKKHGAEFYWDYDHQYTDDKTMEAGRFLKENLELFPEHSKLEDFRGLEREKQIRIFELPTDVLQAKTVHKILEREDRTAVQDCTDTAVVLCDEELLMPVIMSLPQALGELNVTMGYPMKNTPVFSFIDTLLHMQQNIRLSREGRVQFYHKDVASILLHPYMRDVDVASNHTLLHEIAESNLIQVDRELFKGELERKIFFQVESALELVVYLRKIFLHILETLSSQKERMHQELDREFIFQLLIHLNKLENLIASRPAVTIAILARLFRKLLSGLRVPFEGEPLSGLQLMGILETRLLDFKHVILLSLNEDVMPRSHAGQSYIPYTLRIGFRMPAREDMDAIYAYYFHRLLQRAEKIDLLYNSKSEGVRTGEMSRYLYQLIYSHGIQVTRPGMEVMAKEIPPLVIPHTRDIGHKLDNYRIDREGERYLSPSAINTFIDCSLKFYLRYLAGIGEPDEVQEEIDAAGFGTVVHESIRILYTDITDRNQGNITREELEKLGTSGQPEKVLREVFLAHHYRGRKKIAIEGRNIIIFRVMLRYLGKIIETDLNYVPFRLVSAESTYKRDLEIKVGERAFKIRLGGKIDRVDHVEGSYRVIDYKTGNNRTGFSNLEGLFDGSLSSRNGAAFQTLFYAWLVSEGYPGAQISPGLYIMKELYRKDFDPCLTMGSHHHRTRIDSFTELESDFIAQLGDVIGSMFDPGTSFIQTGNESRCRYCDFAAICNRNSID
ncbi:MAG: PD-(D/E)XK nuclease family protein [Bacteroidales bacterium]|nr:PD-(D/E)XK nuclease family protein [Bacteroidales bacterium]